KVEPFVIKPQRHTINTLRERREPDRATVVIVERTITIAVDIADIARLGHSPGPRRDTAIFDFLNSVINAVAGKAEKLANWPPGLTHVIEWPDRLVHKQDFVLRVGIISP